MQHTCETIQQLNPRQRFAAKLPGGNKTVNVVNQSQEQVWVLAHHDPQRCQVLGLSANAGLEGLGLDMTREQMGSAPVQKTPLAPGQSTTFACNYGEQNFLCFRFNGTNFLNVRNTTPI